MFAVAVIVLLSSSQSGHRDNIEHVLLACILSGITVLPELSHNCCVSFLWTTQCVDITINSVLS